MSSPAEKIKIGTRGSPLALAQAYSVRDALRQAGNLSQANFEIVTIKTSGDQLLDVKLQNWGGKGLFTKEIEQALLDKKIDIAVHSGKDVPTKRQNDLELLAALPREDYRDVFISKKYTSLSALPQGAIIGTASVRRTAQLKHIRPDLQITLLRGNVQTRLKKLVDGVCDATLLAYAGLNRMNMQAQATEILDIDKFLPAPAQGIIMIEGHKDMPHNLSDLLSQINCSKAFNCALTERAILEAIEGNCETPLAALAQINGNNISLIAEFLSPDGTKKIRQEAQGPQDNGYQLGFDLGINLKKAFLKC